MSEKLGPRVFGHDHGQPFLGLQFSAAPHYSNDMAREIDDEIRRIIEAAYLRATGILLEHRESLSTLSETLVRRETIGREQFTALLAGKTEAEVFGEARVVPTDWTPEATGAAEAAAAA
jgi:cell division protease FtsH